MRLSFTKCNGSGNDFPMVDARRIALDDTDWNRIARMLADRSGPVGGDGLLLLTPGDAEHAFGMRMFNADGTEAETCLNGLRCVARAGLESLSVHRARVRLKTSSAEIWYEPPLAEHVTTIGERTGPVALDVSAWLRTAEARHVDLPIPPLGSGVSFTAVKIPNPHLVAFVDAIDDAALAAIGRRCEAAPAWLPERANVSFVRVLGDRRLFVRTFERGVGLTDSCGSAMAASAYVACLTSRMVFGEELTILNRGGMVRAAAEADGVVRLSGNATFEWTGSIVLDMANGRASDLVIDHRFDHETVPWQRLAERVLSETDERSPANRLA